ncbi:hypothetical protein P154DRAFT_616196 [Amniculicola lignicola CBS 123094]|uniref:Uncharacterized protein n=1 Tax=Amniculicola lignicola CBS 123094 TaxID=1392246 RepID=A0A6A5WUH8_9PLEO|nr:hypothetical protein P154DRAFT_616196 [Amniculicola lignicola CBS 123094]
MEPNPNIPTLLHRIQNHLPPELRFEIFDLLPSTHIEPPTTTTPGLHWLKTTLPPLLTLSPSLASQAHSYLRTRNPTSQGQLTLYCTTPTAIEVAEMLVSQIDTALGWDMLDLRKRESNPVTNTVARHVARVPARKFLRDWEYHKGARYPGIVAGAKQDEFEDFLRCAVLQCRPHQGFISAINMRYLVSKSSISDGLREVRIRTIVRILERYLERQDNKLTDVSAVLVLDARCGEDDEEYIKGVVSQCSRGRAGDLTVAKAAGQEVGLFKD